MKLYSFFLSTWHISLSITYSKSIHFFSNSKISFFLRLSSIPSYICRYMSLSIYHIFLHSPIVGHTGCFHDLTKVNNAAVNIGVHTSFWISVFIFFRHIPRSEIAGSYGSSSFNFLRKFHTVFQNSCLIYVPTNSVQVFPFLHSPANICHFLPFQ